MEITKIAMKPTYSLGRSRIILTKYYVCIGILGNAIIGPLIIDPLITIEV